MYSDELDLLRHSSKALLNKKVSWKYVKEEREFLLKKVKLNQQHFRQKLLHTKESYTKGEIFDLNCRLSTHHSIRLNKNIFEILRFRSQCRNKNLLSDRLSFGSSRGGLNFLSKPEVRLLCTINEREMQSRQEQEAKPLLNLRKSLSHDVRRLYHLIG